MTKPDLGRRRIESEYDEGCDCEVLAVYIDEDDGSYMLADEVDKAFAELRTEIVRLKAENERLKSGNTERHQIEALLDNNPHALARMEMSKRLSQSEPKSLDQSIFDGAPDWAEYAAVTKCGLARFYEVDQAVCEKPAPFWVCKKWPVGESQIIGDGFDASDWRNSLIKRESAGNALESERALIAKAKGGQS